jgi:hypothetical protein
MGDLNLVLEKLGRRHGPVATPLQRRVRVCLGLKQRTDILLKIADRENALREKSPAFLAELD